MIIIYHIALGMPICMLGIMVEPKFRPFTISLPPELKERAEVRAQALGLNFSRYVHRCLEAELQGQVNILRDEASDPFDLERAVDRAREFMLKKRDAIDFEADVAALLATLPLEVTPQGRVGEVRVDFLAVAADGRRLAVECRANVRRNYALALGQCLLLRASDELDAVALVVPYLKGLDPRLIAELERRQVILATPDALAERVQGWLEA